MSLITRWTRQSDRTVDLNATPSGVAQMLADMAHHAATIPFHDEHGTPSGHWDQVLGADQSFALALLATADLPHRSAPLREAIAQARTTPPSQAATSITALVETMLQFARDLDQWLAPAQAGGAIEPRWAHARAEAALDQVLGPQLQRLFDQVTQAEETRLAAHWSKRGWWDDDPQPWRNTVREGEVRGIARAVERAWAQRLIRDLADAADRFLEDMAAATDRAIPALHERLRSGAHEGHAALVIAFLEVFRHARGELDALPERILDQWLASIGAHPAPARGDRVLLAVVPRPGSQPEVPRGLLIPAGKDAVFAADAALAVTSATVTELRSWAHGGLSVSRAAPGKDGSFGEATPEPAWPMALLTSSQLALPGGTRRIRVRLLCAETPTVPPDIEVAVSTGGGWVEVAADWRVLDGAITLSLLLSADFPALAPCLGTDLPAIRLTARAANDLHVTGVLVTVAVRDAPGVAVSTPAGPASASAAAPFGNPPFVGGWLRIDHPALAKPPLDRLVVRFDWASVPAGDAGFAGYYRGYAVDSQGQLVDRIPFDNAAFGVTLSAPVSGWDATKRLPLFAPASLVNAPPIPASPPPDVLDDNFEDAPPLMPEEGPVAPSSWLAAAGAGGVVDTDHVLVTLASPSDALGHGLHAANVQWATEAMARTELPATRPGWLRRVLRALLGWPKAIAAKLSGRHSVEPALQTESQPVLLPNPPFQPMLAGIALDYATSAQEMTLHHLPPCEPAERVKTGPLFPPPITGPVLELVVDGAEPGAILPLLWQLRSPGDAPHWSYRSAAGWAPLPVLEDGTAGLSVSGILRLLVPADAPAGGLRIQARFTGAAPQALAVLPNAFSATRRIDRDVFDPIAAGTVAKLSGITGVASVVQPIASTGGSLAEAKQAVRARMIEQVRHGNRAQTAWDVERMILAAFPQVLRVRVVAPGEGVTALVEADARTRATIAAWLAERQSPFAQVVVAAPTEVPIDITAELVSDGDLVAVEAAVEALIEDELWLDDTAGVEAVRAAVLRLLLTRPEVRAVERLRVSLGDSNARWRVPVPGTISIAAIEGAARW